MPYATAVSASGSDAIITLGADSSKNYTLDLVAYSYNAANPNSIGQLTIKRDGETILNIDVPDGGCGYIYSPMEFATDGHNIPMEVKLHGVGTGSSARIGKLSIKYRE